MRHCTIEHVSRTHNDLLSSYEVVLQNQIICVRHTPTASDIQTIFICGIPSSMCFICFAGHAIQKNSLFYSNIRVFKLFSFVCMYVCFFFLFLLFSSHLEVKGVQKNLRESPGKKKITEHCRWRRQNATSFVWIRYLFVIKPVLNNKVPLPVCHSPAVLLSAVFTEMPIQVLTVDLCSFTRKPQPTR